MDTFARAQSLSRYGRLGLGSANAGNLFTPMSDEDAHALFQAAWDAGGRHFDTAPDCGLGVAEQRLGEVLRTRPRQEFHLSTEVGRVLVPNVECAGDPDPFGHFAGPATVRRVADDSEEGVRRSLEDS